MSSPGMPNDPGSTIGSSIFGSGNPQLRNLMLAQMLMRQQQPQGNSPWASAAGAGGNIIQAMELQRLMNQGQAQPPLAQTPHPPTPLQSPTQGLPAMPSGGGQWTYGGGGMGGQMPGTSSMPPSLPGTSAYGGLPQSPTFLGGIAPFGTSGGTGSLY